MCPSSIPVTEYLREVTGMAVNQRTLIAQTYDEIREAILAGQLRPGCPVRLVLQRYFVILW